MTVYIKKRYVLFTVAIICLSFFGCSNPKSDKVAIANPLQASKDEHSIAMMSDTQFYSQSNPEIFYKMTQYLVDNAKTLNLSYVMHTGDIVENFDNEAQWQVASTAMQTLKNIPHGVLAGNHDTGLPPDRRANYGKYFGEWRFKDNNWYGESHENNSAHYDLVKIGKTNFIFVYISDEPNQCCIDFANAAFKKYSDYVGVLCVHNYLTPEQILSPIGEQLKQNIVSKNKNVYMVFSGHFFATYCLPTQIDDNGDGINDRTVYQIIANYQQLHNSGYMLILKIDESKGTVSAQSYSPITNDYLQDDNGISTSRFSFQAPWNM